MIKKSRLSNWITSIKLYNIYEDKLYVKNIKMGSEHIMD